MYLCDGKIGNNYRVSDIELPTNMEKGSTLWMLLSALFQLIVAWAVTFIVYRIGLLL